MNVIDIALIVFVVAVAAISAKRGFLKSLFNIVAYAVAGFIAKLLCSPVTAYIYTNFLRIKVTDVLNEILPSGSVSGEVFSIVEKALGSLPPFVSSLASQFGIFDPDTLGSASSEVLSVEMLEAEYLGPIVSSVLSIIVLIVLFIVFAIILRIILAFVNKSLTDDKHKVIKGTNMMLGAALGVVKSVIPAGLICALLNITAPLINNASFYTLVTDSYFCKLIADILN